VVFLRTGGIVTTRCTECADKTYDVLEIFFWCFVLILKDQSAVGCVIVDHAYDTSNQHESWCTNIQWCALLFVNKESDHAYCALQHALTFFLVRVVVFWAEVTAQLS
jgi:hypothetical protein